MAASVAGPRVGWVLGWDPVATAPGSDSAHADARAATVAGTWVECDVGLGPGRYPRVCENSACK